jgi:NAD-dependent dihydropyrimidine dehydrogenase PreA subunit
MSFTIVSSICEGHSDCIPLCPEECIHQMRMAEGRRITFIDNTRCTDCGACQFACPIQGAVLDVWQPELQAASLPGPVQRIWFER